MLSLRSFLLGLTFCAVLCGPFEARAAFLFCNQSETSIEAAFGSREKGVWLSEGWWQIQPGQCARVMNKPLSQRFYFYYARELALPSKEGASPMVWSGKYSFCVDTKAFKIEGDNDCESRGYRRQGFQEVDVGTTRKTYTLTFQGRNGR